MRFVGKIVPGPFKAYLSKESIPLSFWPTVMNTLYTKSRFAQMSRFNRWIDDRTQNFSMVDLQFVECVVSTDLIIPTSTSYWWVSSLYCAHTHDYGMVATVVVKQTWHRI